MPTNLALDDQLIEEAKKIGNHRTKKEAVTAALEEYVRTRKQQAILELVGKVEYYPDYDHKALRRKTKRHNSPADELDYETAAEFFNTCRRHGVAGAPIDMLICAVSARMAWPIFTTDNDFTHYAAHLPIRLHARAE